jgi:hypothetical protein
MSRPNEEFEAPLDQIAKRVGGKILLPIIKEKFTQLMNSNDFKQHYAIVFTLGAIVEGCADRLLKRDLNTLDTLVQQYIQSIFHSSLFCLFFINKTKQKANR